MYLLGHLNDGPTFASEVKLWAPIKMQEKVEQQGQFLEGDAPLCLWPSNAKATAELELSY